MTVEQHSATSEDGTAVPYFQISPQDSGVETGPRPTLLYGYGGFEISLTPAYNAVAVGDTSAPHQLTHSCPAPPQHCLRPAEERAAITQGLAWLERGGVYVVANIRGGGEFGPAWHQSALREKRHRAYDVSCCWLCSHRTQT
jgi:prolyl oligopeptidase